MMLQEHRWTELTASQRHEVLTRPAVHAHGELRAKVRHIIDDVRAHGDAALARLTLELDGVAPSALEVGQDVLRAAWESLSPTLREAMATAKTNIETFHLAQAVAEVDIEVAPGVRCMRQTRPIQRVGLYVPAGSAPLPSTVLMLAVPAALARCPVRVLCSPPQRDGGVDPCVLAAAHLAGVQRVFAVGGAQAVAAMAYGTATIPAVHKIYGPGNAWVTEAKIQCAEDPGGAALDLPAGPSEVMVLADDTANADYVAADLLSQAEHGPDSQVVLVCTHAPLIPQVRDALAHHLRALPRAAIAKRALSHSVAIVVPHLEAALEVVNQYAPEHLIVQVREPRAVVPSIHAAGSVFLGPWTPESVGDYASGTNHVLPTYGYARAYSGLSLADFSLRISFQELSPAGLAHLGPKVAALAEAEGLGAHRLAVDLRMSAPEVRSAEASTDADLLRGRARSAVRAMQAYSSARSLVASSSAFLDANESPEDAPLDSWAAAPLRLYPEPQPRALVLALAELYGAVPEQIMVGRGSDDGIDVLVRTFCEAGRDAICITPPTYGMYGVAAATQGARVLEAPLDPETFALDPEAVLRACDGSVKLVFVCTPNNPTGNAFPGETIARLASGLWPRALLVVDEAYVEFSQRPSAVSLLPAHPNLVVLRTLSKAWALAGLRCGAVLAHPAVIELLQKVRAPYPLASPAVSMALAALSPEGSAACAARVQTVLRERARLAEGLRALARVERVFSSEANFVLVRTTDARGAVAKARRAGISIRDRSDQAGLNGCVRISVGTSDQTNALLEALR